MYCLLLRCSAYQTARWLHVKGENVSGAILLEKVRKLGKTSHIRYPAGARIQWFYNVRTQELTFRLVRACVRYLCWNHHVWYNTILLNTDISESFCFSPLLLHISVDSRVLFFPFVTGRRLIPFTKFYEAPMETNVFKLVKQLIFNTFSTLSNLYLSEEHLYKQQVSI